MGKRYDQLCLAENTGTQKSEIACLSRAGVQAQAGWPQLGMSDCPTLATVFLGLSALVLPSGEDQRPSRLSLSCSGTGGPRRTLRKEPWEHVTPLAIAADIPRAQRSLVPRSFMLCVSTGLDIRGLSGEQASGRASVVIAGDRKQTNKVIISNDKFQGKVNESSGRGSDCGGI